MKFNKKASAPPATGAAIPSGPKDVQKRWMVVVGVVCTAAVLGGMFMGDKREAPNVKPKAEAPVNLTPQGADKAAFQATYQTDIEASAQQAKQAMQMAEELRKELEALKKARSAGSAEVGSNAGISQPPIPESLPPPPAPPIRSMPPAAAPAPLPDLPPVMEKAAEPAIFEAPKVSGTSSSEKADGTAVKAKVKYVKNPNAGLLPQGSFVSVETLNGIDAGMGTQSRSDPLPILLNIKDFATLPGLAKYDLRNCFALGSGYGDPSSERVYARFSRISCVDRQERLVLTQEINAVLVDSDGVVGMRGKVVDRQGAKLAAATAAGVAQGLSSALGSSQGTVTSSLLGDQTSLSGTAALRASGLRGIESAANQLAQWYLKEANSIFPVITITANRKGSLLFTENATMVWSSADAKYQKDVRPE